MDKKTNYEKNGNKYFRVTKTINGEKKEFYGKSKSEAEALRDEYVKNVSMGLNSNYKEMKIKDLMKIWLYEFVRMHRSYATMDRYECVYRNYVLDIPVANLKVYEVSPTMLQRHYNSMYESGCSSSAIFNLNKLLKTFFNYAISEGYIVTNPCFKILIPKDKNVSDEEAEDQEVDPLTDEEIIKIRESIKKEFEMIFNLGLATGLRSGELLGLSMKNIDLDSRDIKVIQALKKVKKIKKDESYEYEVLLETPKTKNSVRTVPLPSNIIIPPSNTI